MTKSETKLQQSQAADADDTIINALQSALEKLRPKLADAERELASLQKENEA